MEDKLKQIKEIIESRTKTSHKGENGKLLIVGGSPDYVGAPALCGFAALRCGIDLVTIATQKEVGFSINSMSPELIVKKFEKYDNEAVSKITQLAESFDVALIGNGLGKKNIGFAKDVIESICKKYPNKKLVIDADGIEAFKKCKIKSTKNIIITPHKREFEYLADLKGKNNEIRKEADSFVKNFDGVVVIKGNHDLIAQKNKIEENRTGNAGMTAGGTGDVLAGIIAAFYCFCDDSFMCACAGTQLSGKAGDMAFMQCSYGLSAIDIIENIHQRLFFRQTKTSCSNELYV
ncbi:MAG: NAD(P)H-hydrate dehydratase [Candidatus Nanohalarchaeota archaeon]|nr:MAG: NAD(P)H-hydrate dehydratase [Candidatus Nanohaloarchaeota archaeon]